MQTLREHSIWSFFKLYETVTFECFLNIPNQAEDEHSSNDA